MNKLFLVAASIIGVLVAGFFVLNSYINNEKQVASIASFEECTAAGYPSLDSYPEQCETPDGKRFVRRLPVDELDAVTSPITVRGTVTCLPHWNTSGPQTLECAIGFQDEGGGYYALRDPNPSSLTVGTWPMNTPVAITGTLIPGSVEKYQSLGTIEVREISPLS